MKRAMILILGLLVSAACIYYSLQGTTWPKLKEGFRTADYRTLPLMLFLLAGFYWLKTRRWARLLSPVADLSTWQLLPPMLIGFAANNLLPAHLGEFVRVYEVRRRFGVPASTALSTVVLERIFDVLAILALFAAGLAFSRDFPESYRQWAVLLGCGAVVVVAAVAAYLFWTETFLDLAGRVCSWAPFLPDVVTAKLVGMLRTGADGLAALRSAPAVLAIAANSLLQWLMNGMIAYLALRAFGIPVTPATGLIVTGITAFGVTVPSTPGYVGVIQACFQISMNAQAVQPEESLVFVSSVYYHMSMFVPVTCAGIWCLLRSGMHLVDLKRSADHVADDRVPGELPAGHQRPRNAE